MRKRKEEKDSVVIGLCPDRARNGSNAIRAGALDDENDDYDENFRINFSGTLGGATSVVRVDLSKSL
jgi:hypothetical protein